MSQFSWSETDTQAVNIARALAADAVQNAGNGHPGTAISLAPVAYTLFAKEMRHDPRDPQWLGRDRFVLSIGHSSLTLYAQLFLHGYGLELEDIKNLRQWNSLTPGHPEYGHTSGVEMTTGPLGQGLSSAVGMAMAARRHHGLFDPSTPQGQSPFDHFIYVLAGDGCLQEGITSEACSLAGTQELGNLILIYDDNEITIEGHPSITFTEDVLTRYEAYGWHTQHVQWRQNGHDYIEDVQALHDALEAARNDNRPSIIKLSTIMSWPAPHAQNTAASHGSALGEEEIIALKKAMGMSSLEPFDIDTSIVEKVRQESIQRAEEQKTLWTSSFDTWAQNNPENHQLLTRLIARKLPENWEAKLPSFNEACATRAASGKVINALAPVMPELWGGSADLAGSNNTAMKNEPSFIPENRQTSTWSGNIYGRNIHFGIREHAMGAIINGMTLEGLTRPYAGTFFVFSDYMRPSVRLAALMNIPSLFIWTHDSIGVGEDGPTHQPIEHLWSYRSIPNFNVIRPADANETVYAWKHILEKEDSSPSSLILSRQSLPILEGTNDQGVARGGYILKDASKHADVILLATGSEVYLALQAQEVLEKEGIGARVVSLPCIEWFEQQDQEYKDNVLLPSVKARVSVEAGSTFGWKQYVGDYGLSVGIDHYGASAPGGLLFEKFGITVTKIVEAARQSVNNSIQ
ncbi:MAG: transketolase [Actinomycetaceae bacterium]|nr:transketolase [Actinomycetaceae bacterium]